MAARRYSDLQLACAVAESANMKEVLTRLRLAPRGANYANVGNRIARLGLATSHFKRRVRRRLPPLGDEELRAAVCRSKSLADVFRHLGLDPRPGFYKSLRKRIEDLALDTSHFLGQAWRTGSTRPVIPRRPLEEVLVEGWIGKTAHLRERLIREGVKERMCESCGLSEWRGGPIPLELDHVNGRTDDNRLHNLRIICPNCHAQTLTYRGRNVGRSSYSS